MNEDGKKQGNFFSISSDHDAGTTSLCLVFFVFVFK